MENINITQAQNFIGDVIARSQKDSSFKAELMNNPKAVINEHYGLFLKNDLDLVVEDQTDSDTIYLNIPKQVELEDNVQLSEEELEMVSGGGTTSFVCGAIVGGLIYDAVCEFASGVKEGWNYKE